MEVARAFHTPQRRHHLAELRIEADQSPVAFSDPCAAGHKRRCLFPIFSPRKKMLVELSPFSAPALSPPASAGRTASVFSSPLSPSSGRNRSFTFRASPEQLLSPAGSNRSSPLALLTSLERPLTPMGSTASSGFGVLSSRPWLSPGPGGASATGVTAFLTSPKPARTGSTGNDGGELALLASPKPAFGRTGSSASPVAKALSPAGPCISGGGDLVVSPPLVLTAPRMPISPVRKSEGSTLWSRRRGSKRQGEEKLHITLPPKKVAKTGSSVDGETSCRATLSVASTRPCCTFVNSPAKASKEEVKRDILTPSAAFRSSSTAGTCGTFVTSPTRPSAVDKASGPERGARLAGVGGGGAGSSAACAGAEMVVSVTYSCGARKEFCFDHCH
ncbi:unnamed protein product [Alopecurus aequalis]